MFQRIIGVFRLNAKTFEEIEHDQSATTQAAIVVVFVALLSGVGAGLVAKDNFLMGFFASVIGTVLGWLVWSAVSLFVGTKFFGGQADMGEMLRVIGFAYAPQLLGIIPIPCIGGLVGGIWSMVAGFIAVRQGLDLDNAKAFFTIIIGAIFYFILMAIVGTVLGVGSALSFLALGGGQ